MDTTVTTREQILDAALDVFLDPDYEVFKGVTVEKVAQRAGVAPRTVKRYFSDVHQLRASLIDRALDPARIRFSREVPAALNKLIADEHLSAPEMFDAIAEAVWWYNDQELATTRLEACLAAHATPGSRETQKVDAVYGDYLRLAQHAILHALVSGGTPDQPTMDSEEFARIAVALSDGLMLRQMNKPDLADEHIALYSKALQALGRSITL